MLDLLNRISVLYNIPGWMVNTGAIIITAILIAFPFVVRRLMQPKYYPFRELILFKVLWRWKYKKGDIVGLWCYCPKCQAMLMCDDENCRNSETLQGKNTFFVCNTCGGNEQGRVVGGDRRYALSLVKRDIWKHIQSGTYTEMIGVTKEALAMYRDVEFSKKESPEPKEETIIPDSASKEEPQNHGV